MVQDSRGNLLGVGSIDCARELIETADTFRQWLVLIEHEQDDEACLQQMTEHRRRVLALPRMVEVGVAAVAHEVVLGLLDGRKRMLSFAGSKAIACGACQLSALRICWLAAKWRLADASGISRTTPQAAVMLLMRSMRMSSPCVR